MNPIEIHIDELVLEGVAPGDRHAVAEAVASELARLTANAIGSVERATQSSRRSSHPRKPGALLGFSADPSASDGQRTVDRLDAGTLRLGLHAQPGALGTEIALTVHESLGMRHER